MTEKQNWTCGWLHRLKAYHAFLQIKCQVCIKIPFKNLSKKSWLPKDTWSIRYSLWGHPRSVASLAASGSRRGISLFPAPSRIPCGKEVKVPFDFRGLTWSRKFGVVESAAWTARRFQEAASPNENTGLLELLQILTPKKLRPSNPNLNQRQSSKILKAACLKVLSNYFKFSHVLSLVEQRPLKSRKWRS